MWMFYNIYIYIYIYITKCQKMSHMKYPSSFHTYLSLITNSVNQNFNKQVYRKLLSIIGMSRNGCPFKSRSIVITFLKWFKIVHALCGWLTCIYWRHLLNRLSQKIPAYGWWHTQPCVGVEFFGPFPLKGKHNTRTY